MTPPFDGLPPLSPAWARRAGSGTPALARGEAPVAPATAQGGQTPALARGGAALAAGIVPPGTRRLLGAWLGLAVGSLVVAGLFAALAAFARTPALYRLFSAGQFQRALVAHVTFAFTVWFLAFAGALWVYLAWRAGLALPVWPAWAGLATSVGGAALAAVPAVTGAGQPHLVDYVPAIDHPLFWSGLALVGAGAGLQAAAYLVAWRGKPVRRVSGREEAPEALAMAVGAAALLLAAAVLGVSLLRLAPGTPLGFRLRVLSWGPGHLLQFLHVAGMTTAWLVASAVAVGTLPRSARTLRVLAAGSAPFLGVTAALYFWWRPEALLTNHLVTLFTFWGLGAGAVPLGLMLALAWRARDPSRPGRRTRLPWGSPLFSGAALSMALFAAGGLLGVVGFNQDTRVPAHYHGMVGAVTLAYMGLAPLLLELTGRRVWSARLARWQPYLYGLGLVGIMAGMQWAGGHGAPRKTFGFGWANAQALVAMNVMGAGSLLAIVGGLAFVWNVGIPLLRRRA